MAFNCFRCGDGWDPINYTASELWEQQHMKNLETAIQEARKGNLDLLNAQELQIEMDGRVPSTIGRLRRVILFQKYKI